MALSKEIIGSNGVLISYHRIVKMDIWVNFKNHIEVASYINSDGRAKEKILDEAQEKGEDVKDVAKPYIIASFYTAPYDESMSIIDAYNYLKTLPEFEGAEDIFDSEEQKAEVLSLNEE